MSSQAPKACEDLIQIGGNESAVSVKDAAASTEQLLLSRRLGEDIVTIHVGADLEARTFVLHKDLLCQKSEVFDRMFNGRFEEATRGTVTLPVDDPEAFEAVVEWLYRGTFSIGDCDVKELKSNMTDTVVDIAILAAKYLLSELVDRATSRYVYIAKNFPASIAIRHMKRVYENTLSSSRLRCMLLRSVAFYMTQKTEGDVSDLDAQLSHDLRSTNGLLEDLLPLLRVCGRKCRADPLMVPYCEYHEHPPAHRCPNKRRKHFSD